MSDAGARSGQPVGLEVGERRSLRGRQTAARVPGASLRSANVAGGTQSTQRSISPAPSRTGRTGPESVRSSRASSPRRLTASSRVDVIREIATAVVLKVGGRCRAHDYVVNEDNHYCLASTPSSMARSSLKTTSHDVAREVGVSQSTVSRAIRRDPRVHPGTAARVLSAAERLGYAPNASARSLVTSHTGIVAVVLADITNPFYPQLVEALHEQLARAGYRMILFNERTDSRGDGGIERLLGSGGADGAVFLSVTIDAGVADLLSLDARTDGTAEPRRRGAAGGSRPRRPGGRRRPGGGAAGAARPHPDRVHRRSRQHLDQPRSRGRVSSRARAPRPLARRRR